MASRQRFPSGFTLIELMIAILVITILVSLAAPTYTNVKEKALDKEAVAVLVVLGNAERQYISKTDDYWPPIAAACGAGVTSVNNNVTQINGNLSLSLTPNPSWEIRVDNVKACAADGVTPAPYYIIWAFRGTSASHTRNWSYRMTDTAPVCSGTCFD